MAKLRDKQVALSLAEAILATAKAREESYDIDKADAQEEQCEKDETIFDFNEFYGLTLEQAAEQQCPAEFVEPVAMLLRNNWNDSLDWAKKAVL